ncbi:hypothetical protein [Campylobacter geochelonis]|uniref:hypothetical protein n=1 Tax=Campylobacter geochelonis TaxID=1780362 RepID=UPI000770B068|nr:hypothetical protein [Campylobacter geochelonis]CZE46017.1 Uncharacterised protein [Campylobacter geochelonis]CZE49757.1 Uncharacterised protein [Campylobacter geochelonis]
MKKLFKIAILAIVIAFGVVGCDEKKEFGNIHFDRDVCEHCKMLISDKLYAVDALVADKHYYFDDIGCLIEWSKNQKIELENAKIYVADASSGEFFNAKDGFWYGGFLTPMNYGFAAFKKEQNNGKKVYKFSEVINLISTKPHSHEMHKAKHSMHDKALESKDKAHGKTLENADENLTPKHINDTKNSSQKDENETLKNQSEHETH